jgi:hypothetical protein
VGSHAGTPGEDLPTLDAQRERSLREDPPGAVAPVASYQQSDSASALRADRERDIARARTLRAEGCSL